jgi:uroporphyrinogen III methyltransferase/synthase
VGNSGKVYIIGAGPGDPGLITIRGINCLRYADVVVYDHLASEELLRYASPQARLIYVGKKGGEHTLPQEEINRLLLKKARQGHVVARLKGGDPFIFGRGGEEAEVLAYAGIPFEIVPGVTSGVSVPAYAGIPLTHRGYASTVAFVTGHEDPAKEQSDVDWRNLAGIGTLVFLMGIKNLSKITKSLIQHGKDAETPSALVRWGTTADQATITGSLKDIAKKAQKNQFAPPAILVVGQVVKLREKLNWFESKPLFGKGVVVTRPEAQADGFAELLRKEGARVIYFPTIEITPPASWKTLDRAIKNLESYAWLVFTSANGVRFFFRRLKEQNRDLRDLKGIRICAIGPATAETIGGMGIRVDLVPASFISEGVVEAFKNVDIKGCRVLLPRASKARDVIPEGLIQLGAKVDVVTAYRTRGSGRNKKELETFLKEGKVHVITFTSPSTVANFMEIMGKGFLLPEKVKIACIGPVTAAAVHKAGLPVDILQENYTIPGLVDALAGYFAQKATS